MHNRRFSKCSKERYSICIVCSRGKGGWGQGAGGRGREVQNFPLPRVPFNPGSCRIFAGSCQLYLLREQNIKQSYVISLPHFYRSLLPWESRFLPSRASRVLSTLLPPPPLPIACVSKCMQKGIRRSLLCRLYCILLNQGCLCLLCPQKCISERNGPKTSPISTTC